MPFVSNWEKIERRSNVRKLEPLVAEYFFKEINGDKLFQISTNGSVTRKNKGKSSQNIQFDKQGAIELISIFKKEFSIE